MFFVESLARPALQVVTLKILEQVTADLGARLHHLEGDVPRQPLSAEIISQIARRTRSSQRSPLFPKTARFLSSLQWAGFVNSFEKQASRADLDGSAVRDI